MNQFLAETGAAAAYPEIFVASAAMALLMLGVFWKKADEAANFIAVAALGIASVIVLAGGGEARLAFGGAFVADNFARLMKILVLFGSAAAIVLSFSYMRAARMMRFEYPVLVMLSTTGMMMMISANDLIALYVGLELQSLALYVLASFHRESAKSAEAGMKYFVLGALSSGMLLYGSSLIYGFTGATGFAQIAQALSSGDIGLGLIFGLVFLISGLAFKVSAVPFHMWTPDVYEGAPTPVTAFFASAPKVAAMALFVRAMYEPFAGAALQWQQVIVFVSIASMGLGAFAAIGQTNIKRLLAYSSIANMGFALVGLAAANEEGVRGVILYMMIYMIMTLGAFACVIAMRRKGAQVEEIGDLAGLARTDKWLAFIFAALMFSLAGIPPLAGFFAKYFVFMAAVKSGLWLLAVFGVVASVVGAYYYLRVVKVMYFDEPAEAFEPVAGEVRFIAVLAGLFAVVFLVIAQPLVALAADAAKSLFS